MSPVATPSNLWSDTFVDEPFNPFVGDPIQTRRTRAYVKVIVGGLDVTNKLEPHLISVHVLDGKEYKCEIELDDRDGKLPIPGINTPVQVSMGWPDEMSLVYDGLIQSIEHGFGRKQGGRRMWIHCNYNQLGRIKTPMQNHLGEGAPPGQEVGIPHTQGAWLQKVAGTAGASLQIHPALAAITRDYWNQANESALHILERHGIDHGAITRVQNANTMVMTYLGQSPGGGATDVHVCKWGVNLIGWRVKPWEARGTWSGSEQQYFSTVKGLWQRLQTKFNLPNPWGSAQANYQPAHPAPTSDVADQDNQGSEEAAPGYMGNGRIIINGEPTCKWNDRAQLIGARPGVDGIYFIMCAEHIYSRQGYITWLDVVPEANTGSGSISSAYSPLPLSATGQPQLPVLVRTVRTGPAPTGPGQPNLVVGGVIVTDASGNIVPGIWNNQAVNDARLLALNTGNPDPLAVFPGVPSPVGM